MYPQANFYHVIAQLVKNPPAMQETLVPFLGQEDPLEGIGYPLQYCWASLVAKLVKNLPAVWETWVRSLGWENPLENIRLPTPVFKAIHSSILAQRIPWTIYIVHRVAKSWTQLSDSHFHFKHKNNNYTIK